MSWQTNPVFLDEMRTSCFVNEPPVYGENYKAGYDFFISHLRPGITSRGIAWFTRFDRRFIPVTHMGMVTGDNACIEAHISTGVAAGNLATYFENPHVAVFFRKPKGLDDEIAGIMIKAAMTQLGKGYDKRLLGAHALSGSFLGRLASLVTRAKSDEFIAWLLDHPDLYVCSEFIGWVKIHVPRYAGHGVLRYAPATLNPQEFFECDVLYEPWKTSEKEA